MMRFFLVLILWVTATSVIGQKHEHDIFDRDHSLGNGEIRYVPHNDQIADPIRYFTSSAATRQINPATFPLLKKQEGPASSTFTYEQHVNGLPVLDAFVRINIPNNKEVSVAVSNSSVDLEHTETKEPFPDADVYFLKEDGLILPAKKTYRLNEDGITILVLTDEQDNELFTRPAGEALGTEKAKAKVFKPNPVTSAHTIYGAPYVDNNDQNNQALDDELSIVTLNVTFEDAVYKLKNKYLTITEHSPPTISPTESANDTFFFNRSDDEFEDVNAFYHISEMGEYLDTLGYFDLLGFAVDVDANGLSGSDNSFFDKSFDPPRITFGTGGVDDAEDGDIAVHEYGHAIMYGLAPGSNQGTERRALDEGIGDYLAVSHSKNIDPYDHRKIMNWDGHNEFWDGRTAYTARKYPDGLEDEIYSDAALWSTAVLRVENNIGREETHKLQFESALSYVSHMSMTDAAELFLRADSVLYGADHYPYLSHIFVEAGFISSSQAAKPSDLVSSGEAKTDKKNLQVLNSAGFAVGSSSLIIKTGSENIAEVRVFDLSGKTVFQKRPAGNTVEFDPGQFKPGMYLFLITTESGNTVTEKIVR